MGLLSLVRLHVSISPVLEGALVSRRLLSDFYFTHLTANTSAGGRVHGVAMFVTLRESEAKQLTGLESDGF